MPKMLLCCLFCLSNAVENNENINQSAATTIPCHSSGLPTLGSHYARRVTLDKLAPLRPTPGGGKAANSEELGNVEKTEVDPFKHGLQRCLLYTSPSPRD